MYLTKSSTNPATRFLGTTWQKISENRFLMGTSGSETPGSTGGSSTVVLQIKHMPKHRHKVDPHYHTKPPHFHYAISNREGSYSTLTANNYTNIVSPGMYRLGGNNLTISNVGKTNNAGGENTGSAAPYTDYQGNGEAFDITPPFYKVHMWERLT